MQADIDGALKRLVAGLTTSLGERVDAVLLYGPHARGTAHETDPVRVCVVLSSGHPETIASAGAALRVAWRTARVRPYVVVRGELARLADVFPVELSRMQRHHRMLHGADPFDGVEVRSEHLRLRLEQALRNHLVRLRGRLALRGDDTGALNQALRGIAEGLAVEAEVLDELCGSEGLPSGVLERLAATRDGQFDRALPAQTLQWLEAAVDKVDRWEAP